MHRIATRLTRLGLALIVGSIAVLAAGTASANAYYADEVGMYRAPAVTCDSDANTISVVGQFGAGPRYAAQNLRVRYFAVDLETNPNYSFWLSPNGAWSTFYHRRWDGYSITPLAPNVPGEFRYISGFAENYGNHRFHVYAQYQWLTTTGWVGTQPIRPLSYGSGFGPTPDCLL